jgi:hypothetical protein
MGCTSGYHSDWNRAHGPGCSIGQTSARHAKDTSNITLLVPWAKLPTTRRTVRSVTPTGTCARNQEAPGPGVVDAGQGRHCHGFNAGPGDRTSGLSGPS